MQLRISSSACCSLFDGCVASEMGSGPDGADSLAVQVTPTSLWPTIRAPSSSSPLRKRALAQQCEHNAYKIVVEEMKTQHLIAFRAQIVAWDVKRCITIKMILLLNNSQNQ
ncbi:hypothetical protein BDZ91DRAFT_286120 [Kalaharituber pfeilii]|nr:hypothetical protein BDZ91DRAFT_286120 [Kalaharituber pfeilii]